MKIKMKKYIIVVLAAGLAFAGCQKKADPIDDFKVTVEYRSTNAKTITSDVTLNPKDSVYFDFTITSPEDMSYVEIQKNGVRIDTFRLNNFANKKSFSLVKGYRADSVPGDYSYRVLARNDRAIFMGDGGKQIKVTITSDLIFWSSRILQAPDTVDKSAKCYYSVSEGKTYSYTEASSVSNKIDFGYYYDSTMVTAGNPATLQPRGHTIYALTNTVAPFQPYNISTWTKNATIFKASTVSFNSITSGGAIRTAAVSALSSGAVNRFSQTDRAAAQITNHLTGQVLVFRTAAGKYGVLNTIYTNNFGSRKESYIQIDVKVEK